MRITWKRVRYGRKRPIGETRANLTPVRDSIATLWWKKWKSGPTGVESTHPLKSQETEPSMEVDVDNIPSLTSGGGVTVSAEEDEMLTGDPTSVAGEMAKLQVSSPDSHELKDGETSW